VITIVPDAIVDTGSPLGEPMFTMISAMAQLERDIIRERVKAGLKNARKKGKTLGRPKVKINVIRAREMKDRGYSLRQIANEMNLPTFYALSIAKLEVFQYKE
jgi:DNA invertase Pin-like site-specific DNA recombinase|tara:strand:+ start:1329 stop:1637 length:309 start_codon:yes stop_codon:yes gene_type:complete